MIAPGMGDEGLPEAPDHRPALAVKPVNGLLQSCVILENSCVATWYSPHRYTGKSTRSFSMMYIGFIPLCSLTTF